MNIEINSQLSHNNSGYGKGIFYVAKLVGLDDKFGFNREFLNRETEYRNNSKTTWYNYTATIQENGFYEYAESNAYKHRKKYYKVENGELIEIDKKEIKEFFNNLSA